MEGLYKTSDFSFSHEILKSIVKVRPVRKLEYQFFENLDDATKFSTTVLDQNGFETIRYGLIKEDIDEINKPEFSQALFTHEFSEAYRKGITFPHTTDLLGHGNGVLISEDGLIVTNYHLVSGSVDFHKKTDSGYFDKIPLKIKNIEIEVLSEIQGERFIYKKFTDVDLIGTFSKTDAYGSKKDLAVLKINANQLSFLKLSQKRPAKFDQIYSIGFSMRTARNEDKLKLLNYENANYDLRISSGLVIKNEDNSFLADTDGAPGNSGSAAVNSNGELVGVYCASTGNGIVDPSKSFRRYVYSGLISDFI
jgi:S1-C subfamily serine protease